MTTNPIARTVYGDVEGEENEGVARFRGVPFADRIDGTRRFAPPRPPRRWEGVRAARTWAPMTPQVADAAVVRDAAYHKFLFGEFHDTPMSEEGLFLNVWTPSVDVNAKRPVMVWLHGGGFATGTPTRPREEPSLFSARGDIVMVAPNHRLGAFGYLFDARGLATPNVGMLDIVAALEWVAENIEAFGGDPNNVTVFGESGGAMKTATLLSMPKAKGLFHRGICQAGVFAAGFPFAPLSAPDARENTTALMRHLGVGDDIKALAAVSMQDLMGAQETLGGGLLKWRPVVDGEVLPVNPAQALLDGSDLNVPMIVGSAAHEADFIYRDVPRTLDALVELMGEPGRRLFDAYAAAHPERRPEDVADAVLGDRAFAMPAIAFAEARAASGHKTYVYELAWGRPGGRATHGAENPFIFDRLETTAYSRGAPEARLVSERVQKAWIAFARGGDPNGGWPAYTASQRGVMIFDANSRVENDPKRAEREAWEREVAGVAR